jgi:pyruvate/2-oxoglutarate/acetoin dehydrogenase E1 component
MSITRSITIRESPSQGAGDDPNVFIYGQDVGVFSGAFMRRKLGKISGRVMTR